MTTDRVVLRGIRARGRHGWYDHEQRDGQMFVVDVVAAPRHPPGAASDDLADTVDYGVVGSRWWRSWPANRSASSRPSRSASPTCVSTDPRVERVEVTLHKPEAPMTVGFDDVEIHVVRDRA